MQTRPNWRITVAKGVPFREAHHIVGEAVVEAIRQGNRWKSWRLPTCRNSVRLSGRMCTRFSRCSHADKRAAKGGVSPKQVAQAIADAKPVGLICAGWCLPAPLPLERGSIGSLSRGRGLGEGKNEAA